MENFDSLWELAKDSSSRVSYIAAKLAASQKNPGKSELILGELAARLCVVHKALDLPSPDQQQIFWRRLEKFLRHLERVCTSVANQAIYKWPNNGEFCPSNARSLPFPTLDAIVSHSIDDRKRAERRLQLGLTNFASTNNETVHNYLSNLQRFSTSRREGLGDFADTPEQAVGQPKKPPVKPEEYPPHVNQSLYTALRLHSSCTCSDSKDPYRNSQQHWGRLRLKGSFQKHGDHILFDTFFSTAPSTILREEVRWQQLRLHVLGMAGSKSVKFCDEKLKGCPADSSSNKETRQVLQVGKFCELLKRSVGNVRIRLNVQAGDLQDTEEIDELDQYIIHQPSIPLAEALKLRQLSTKMRIVLAYILAHSFWQFYNSDWMKTRWTSEFIHFMLEKSLDDEGDTEQPKIKACNPCYSFRFNGFDSDFTEYCDALKIRHRYPRILALGILLVEIGGEAPPREVDTGLSQGQSLVVKINDDWATGKRVLKKQRWPDFDFHFSGPIAQTYKTVVASCFDENIFDTVAEQGIESRRTILYERIVFPLNKLLKDMGWLDTLEAIEPIDLSRRQEQLPRIQSVTPLQTQPLINGIDLTLQESIVGNVPKNTRFYFFDDKVAGTDAGNHADNWFKSLRKDVFPFLPQKPEAGKCVKIAILDTGIDMSDPFISSNSTRITAQTFLSNETSVEDVHGHGTHTAALLLQIAENADIYVARIAKDENSVDPKNIEKAIKAAIEEGVNIITMSFGFLAYEEYLEDIQRAIGTASSASILMFCAASNGGGNTSIAYPANQNEVICVNSANGLGHPSDYNPDEAQEGRNLCALGEGLKSPWPKLRQQRKSGTSFATPIAAALAAVVLDYAQQNMRESDKFKVSKLRKRNGMLEVLVRLMGRKRWGYYYLDPGKLFNKRTTNIYESILNVLVNV